MKRTLVIALLLVAFVASGQDFFRRRTVVQGSAAPPPISEWSDPTTNGVRHPFGLSDYGMTNNGTLFSGYQVSESFGSWTNSQTNWWGFLDGVVQSAFVCPNGKTNWWYTFDGVNDRIFLGTPVVDHLWTTNFLGGKAHISMSCWVKWTREDNDWMALVWRDGLNEGFGLYLHPSKQVRCYGENNIALVTNDTPLVSNQWYHIGYVFNTGDVSRLYIDGILVKTGAVGNGLTDSVRRSLGYGYDPQYAGGYFGGSLDNIKVTPTIVASNTMWNMYLYTHPTNTIETTNIVGGL